MPIPVKNNSISYPSAKERVYQTLKDWIITGILMPGEKVVDTEISQYFEVSRTPVREALQLLSDQRLVDIIPSCGTRVSLLNQEDLAQLYEAIAGINCLALRLACPRIGTSQLQQLDQLNKAFRHEMQNGQYAKVLDADRNFHLHIFTLAGNHYLTDYFNQLVVHANRAEYIFFKSNNTDDLSYETHSRIITLLREQRLDDALRELENNWKSTLTSPTDTQA